MSKYLDNIEARVTGQMLAKRIPLPYPDLSVTRDVNDSYMDLLQTHCRCISFYFRCYRIEVVHGYLAHIPVKDIEKDIEREKSIQYHINSFKRQLADIIYGDAKKIMCQLERAVYNYEWEQAIELLQELKREMR